MFGGVFTPSILTIFGVIMFMRTGFVTGQAGIWAAIAILLISKVITFLTSLSIGAISTNTEVKGGGAYYLISRSLGPEFGGSIGLTLFLAQAISVPFYVLGFVEALVVTFPEAHAYFFPIGLTIATVLFLVNLVGAQWAIKAQYVILAVLGLAIVTLLGGALVHFDVETLKANLDPLYTGPEYDFWVVFAIFFPAVTGIMAGVNMSGDLEDPAKSIPRGTLLAVGVGALVYLIQIILTGGAQSRLQLTGTPYETLLDQALFGAGFLIIAGVFAATVSSALGSLMGAPRILQALARDQIFRFLHPFAKGTLKGDEPRRGLWLTYGITVVVLWLAGNAAGGDALNAVAVVLSMFFLYTYGMTNMAAFVESFSGNPSFRPRFRFFHWTTALAGAAGCAAAAFLIDAAAALIASVIIAAIYVYVERWVLSSAFGDARRGFYYSRVRDNLLKLAGQRKHPKNWRPTTLILSGNPHTRLTLTTYGTWIEAKRGIATLAAVLVGDFRDQLARRQEASDSLQQYIEDNGLNAFSEVVVAPDFDTGMSSLIQCHSIGPIKPNLVLLGWPADDDRAVFFAHFLQLGLQLQMSLVIVVDRGLPAPDTHKRIDIWWRGERNGSLMLILAYLLGLNWEWNQAQIRILRVVGTQAQVQPAHQEIFELAHAARITVEIEVATSDKPFNEVLHEYSHDATLVLLGFLAPSDQGAEAFHAQYDQLLEGMPTTMLVCSSGEADLLA